MFMHEKKDLQSYKLSIFDMKENHQTEAYPQEKRIKHDNFDWCLLKSGLIYKIECSPKKFIPTCKYF